MFRMQNRPAGYSLVSLVVAAILLVSSLAIGTTDSSTLVLPGVALNDSPFAEISTTNLTSMESILYPSNYEVISERPYIMRVDYQTTDLITEYEAEQAAQQFIDKVFSNQSVQQLEIYDLTTKLSRALPRWSLSFINNTQSEVHHIEATVTVNAITGGITGYIGRPILCQGEAANHSTAEKYAITALKELGYHIPVDLRMFYYHWADPTKEGDNTYRFEFQQVVNNAMIDAWIGSICIEIDGITGGVHYLSYEWIQIDKVPTRGIISMDSMGADSVLTLYKVSQDPEDFNKIGPQEFRLCWVTTLEEKTVFDAFTGDVLYVIDTFGTAHSQDETRMSFLIPLLISVIPATLLYIGTRRVLRRQMQY
jgi:hypothetical protein